MEKKLVKWLKIIALVCAIILVIEFSYIIYSVVFSEGKSVYFDGINSLYNEKSGYVTVGSSNNNDLFYEKAKITKYNNKKEKEFEKLYNKGLNSVFFDVIKDSDEYVAVGSYEKDESEKEKGYRSA